MHATDSLNGASAAPIQLPQRRGDTKFDVRAGCRMITAQAWSNDIGAARDSFSALRIVGNARVLIVSSRH